MPLKKSRLEERLAKANFLNNEYSRKKVLTDELTWNSEYRKCLLYILLEISSGFLILK